jgi:hypothetical protein
MHQYHWGKSMQPLVLVVVAKWLEKETLDGFKKMDVFIEHGYFPG